MQQANVAARGALALVSGRSIAQIDRLFDPMRWPAAGLHGLERRDSEGRMHRSLAAESRIATARTALERLAASHADVDVEDKGLTVALHYRRAPHLARSLDDEVRAIARELGGDYQVQPGSCVLEIRPTGATKADAINSFLHEAPFEGRKPVYAGDDLTDVIAFEAVERAGGVSIAVGNRVQAQVSFPTVAHFRRYLADLTQS